MNRIRHTMHADIEAKTAYWAMLLPALCVYLFVMAFPCVFSVVLSLSDFNGGKVFDSGNAWGFAGFRHYVRLAQDPYFWSALKNNLLVVGVSVLGQIPLGFFFAWLIFNKSVRFPGFWQGVLYLPAIISTIVIGIMWQTIFSPYGLVADVMNRLYFSGMQSTISSVVGQGPLVASADLVRRIIDAVGPARLAAAQFTDSSADLLAMLQTYGPNQGAAAVNDLATLFANTWSTDFLNTPTVAMLPILLVILWQYTGFYLIIFLANMQRIDPQIFEAARIDGAKEGQVLLRIMLPALSGIIVTTVILAISGSLKSFDLIFAMTNGGPARITQVLSIYMYDSAFRSAPDYPLANAISTVMIVISFALIILTNVISRLFDTGE